jgi:hypothetical protein
MSGLRQTAFGQFSRPHGRLGCAAGWIMVNRPSNRQRNEWTLVPTLEDALRKAAEVEDAMTALGFVDIRREQLYLKPVPVVAVIGRRG